MIEMKREISKSELQIAVNESRCLSEVVTRLALPMNGKSTSLINRLLLQHSILTTHFDKHHNRRKYLRVTKNCPVCQTPFDTLIGSRDEKTTCSCSCANTHFRSGENSPVRKPDSESRSATICWRYHIKRCVICNEERIVEAHHYNKDHNDNRPENFVPLCPTHHQYVHSRFCDIVQTTIDKYVENFSIVRIKEADQAS